MRDREDRVRFSGYDVSNFKIFVFVASAMISAIGGAMFTLQVGFMSPSFVGIVPSIEMVIFAAVGGRMSLIGAVYGALLVNFGKSYFSESFPTLWLVFMGALFIGVVMGFPNGLAGLYTTYVKPKLMARRQKVAMPPKKAEETKPVAAPAAAPPSSMVDSGHSSAPI
jgi:urea transport system permease protein